MRPRSTFPIALLAAACAGNQNAPMPGASTAGATAADERPRAEPPTEGGSGADGEAAIEPPFARIPEGVPSTRPEPVYSTARERCDVWGHLPEGCRPVGVRRARASGNMAGVAASADASTCTIWSAGDVAPQVVELDLGRRARERNVNGLVMIPEMTPASADVVHLIESSEDGRRFAPALAVEGSMTSAESFFVFLPSDVDGRFLRIDTLTSPSEVAWRELVPVSCKAPTQSPNAAPPPPSADE